MTVKEALYNTKKRFTQVGIPSPESDAQWLLEVVMGLNRSGLILERETELTKTQLERLEAFVVRRETREPLQWILGFTEFYGLTIKTRVGVLIPRPETERLVELVLERVPKAPAKVVDIGTGTGAIALALKAERPNLEITATDINSLALELTRRNAQNLRLEILTVQTSILNGLETVFDVIVSNPPYLPVSDAETLELEVQLEPQEALFSGNDGLDLAREIVVTAQKKLKAGGLLALELDPRNAFILAAELEESGWQGVLLESDLAGRERFVLARRTLVA
jgi:release factor glutamine methyltransferase